MWKRWYRAEQPGESWLLVGELDGWQMFRGSVNENGWLAYRVMRTRAARGRVSFWLSWGVAQRRFAQGRDWKYLAFKKPRVFEWARSIARQALF